MGVQEDNPSPGFKELISGSNSGEGKKTGLSSEPGDFSGSEDKDSSLDSIKTQEWLYRRDQRSQVVHLATLVIVLLYVLSAVFSWRLIESLVVGSSNLDWHVTLPIAAFLLPPTVILISLLRFVQDRPDNDNSSSHGPSIDFLRDLLSAIKDVFGKKE